MPPLSGRDRAAARIQALTRKYQARNRVRHLLQTVYLVDTDAITGLPTYQNTVTQQTLSTPPRLVTALGHITLNQVDTGAGWACAYCETTNKGNIVKCKVCKRKKAASEQKRKDDKATKDRADAATKAIEDEKLTQKRLADAKEANDINKSLHVLRKAPHDPALAVLVGVQKCTQHLPVGYF